MIFKNYTPHRIIAFNLFLLSYFYNVIFIVVFGIVIAFSSCPQAVCSGGSAGREGLPNRGGGSDCSKFPSIFNVF